MSFSVRPHLHSCNGGCFEVILRGCSVHSYHARVLALSVKAVYELHDADL